jgi:hypothetical protein
MRRLLARAAARVDQTTWHRLKIHSPPVLDKDVSALLSGAKLFAALKVGGRYPGLLGVRVDLVPRRLALLLGSRSGD